jgi:hypothetical protein
MKWPGAITIIIMMNPQKEIILKEHFFYITLIGLEVVYMISG